MSTLERSQQSRIRSVFVSLCILITLVPATLTSYAFMKHSRREVFP